MSTETIHATTVAEVAHALVDLCRQQKNLEAMEKYYAPHVVSVESATGPAAKTEGLEGVLAKSKWWVENHDVHSAEVDGPFLGDGNKFAIYFNYDITYKPAGKRMQMVEMGLYTVEGGKVVHEHFFYNTGA